MVEPTLQHTLARSNAMEKPGAKSRRANPGVGLGYVGAYLAASASRNGLAKS